MTEIVALDIEDSQGEDEGDPVWREVVPRLRAAVKSVRASDAERDGAVRDIQVYLFRVYAAALRETPISASRHRLRWLGRAYNVREVRVQGAREPWAEIVAESGVTL